MSNYNLLVFYSTKSLVTAYGNATNWNSTGCWVENFGPSGKFRIMSLTNSVMISAG